MGNLCARNYTFYLRDTSMWQKGMNNKKVILVSYCTCIIHSSPTDNLEPREKWYGLEKTVNFLSFSPYTFDFIGSHKTIKYCSHLSVVFVILTNNKDISL